MRAGRGPTALAILRYLMEVGQPQPSRKIAEDLGLDMPKVVYTLRNNLDIFVPQSSDPPIRPCRGTGHLWAAWEE